MPTASTQVPGTSANRSGTMPRPAIPFIRASSHHVEAPFFDQTNTLTTSQLDLGVIEVPAYGYVRNIVVYVTGVTAANAVASVTFAEDAPFNVLQNIQFNEPNGAQIVQVNDGYELMLTNKFGGYYGPGLSNDPRGDFVFFQKAGGTTATATDGSFRFMIRIPVELDLRSALGALPNQAANATFRVRMALNTIAGVYTTAPTTGPSVRVRLFTETWDQPEVASGGVANQTIPPAMNTTQFWSRQVYNLGAGGSQTVRLTRVGNYLRNIIFILRSGAAGAQGAGQRFNAEGLWTTPAANAAFLPAAEGDGNVTFFLDSRPIQVLPDLYWHKRMWERSGGYGGNIANPIPTTPAAGPFPVAPNAFDQAYGQENGVRVLDFCSEFDGNYGRENRDLWQPTLGSTRFEIQSVFGTLTTGTLTVLTNDVAIAGNVFLG